MPILLPTSQAERAGHESTHATADEPAQPKLFASLDSICLVLDTGHVETINASDFKAKCLAILDRVQATGERLVILKRGQPVAELVPASRTHAKYAQMELKGTVIVAGDIVAPAVPEEHWDSLAR